MPSKCIICGSTEDYNAAINNGKCNPCIEGYMENLECDNTAKDERIKELEGELAKTKSERECLKLSNSAFRGDHKESLRYINNLEAAVSASMNEDHISYVKELQAQLARHEWVSVEDDKPKNDKQVWMCYGGYTYVGYYNNSYKLWYIFNYSGGFTRAEEPPDFWKPISLPAAESKAEKEVTE